MPRDTNNNDGDQRKAENQHPIPQKHVSVFPSHGVTEDVVNDYLAEIDEFTSEKDVRNMAGALPYDAVAENDHCVAAYTPDPVWEEIFEGFGLTFDSDKHAVTFVEYAQLALRWSHQRYAVRELGMDQNQPRNMIITSKDDEIEVSGQDVSQPVADGYLVEYDGELWKTGESNAEVTRLYPASRNPRSPIFVENDVIDSNRGEGDC